MAGPLRVVICGEPSSGKSTLLNALMRQRILPDNIGVEQRPEVTVRGGGCLGAAVRMPDEAGLRPALPEPETLRGAAEIDLTVAVPELAGVQIRELTLPPAENLTDAMLARLREADVLVWTTIASQAWRLTEAHLLERIGRTDGILAVTRADKLRRDDDRDRLLARLRRDAAAQFRAFVPVGASRAGLELAGSDAEAWQATGAPAVLAALRPEMPVVEAFGAMPVFVSCRRRPCAVAA